MKIYSIYNCFFHVSSPRNCISLIVVVKRIKVIAYEKLKAKLSGLSQEKDLVVRDTQITR
jgi:hypothetical protein